MKDELHEFVEEKGLQKVLVDGPTESKLVSKARNFKKPRNQV